MPGVDGFTLAEHIRQRPGLVTHPVIVLPPGGRSGDAGRCRQLGMAAYLPKPVSQSMLFDVLARVASAPAGAPEGEPAPGPVRPLITRHSLHEERQGLRVLLAEDNPVNQRVAMVMLQKRGHEVTVA